MENKSKLIFGLMATTIILNMAVIIYNDSKTPKTPQSITPKTDISNLILSLEDGTNTNPDFAELSNNFNNNHDFYVYKKPYIEKELQQFFLLLEESNKKDAFFVTQTKSRISELQKYSKCLEQAEDWRASESCITQYANFNVQDRISNSKQNYIITKPIN